MSSDKALQVQPPKPTAQVAVFSDLIGIDLTVAFLMQFGGAGLHIPSRPLEDHELVVLLGRENVERLARATNIPSRIPLAKPWLAQYFRAKGDAVATIARKLKTSDNNVYKWTKMQ